MKFISMRRNYLDAELERSRHLFSGTVLDIGGKARGRRGSFSPAFSDVSRWVYLNIDPLSGPDLICSLPDLPIQDGSADTAVMTEVLEYMPDFRRSLDELRRVLKKGGYAVVSSPFLNPIHAGHGDCIRMTEELLKKEISSRFEVTRFERMGGAAAVIFDILRVELLYADGRLSKILYRLLMCSARLFAAADRLFQRRNFYVNTGYFVVGRAV
ncbi:MAG: hypothetical protein A2054_00915 [Deltaproteobacteria bacterium GWA2_55_10]|nr:MAG: hypothetical protein A2054_00915 [Deltaproteobacteria bacterium GWA2_55_10]